MNEQIEMNFDTPTILRENPRFDISKAYTKPKFDGSDYDAKHDEKRLNGQLKRVYDAMSGGESRTLDEIARMTGDPHASISAQLRNLRKVRFGSHEITEEVRGNRDSGLFAYRLVKK